VQRPFLVMELVDGQPLSALLRPDSPMDPVAVRELLAQAADGLAAAHAAGIVHRDVKPANLLVTPDRQVKITDFGIARAAEGIGLTQTGEVMGTPQYLSPEQAQGQTATPASDVYSLGVVAFECLAGRRPFVADTAVATALAHLREPVPELPESVPTDLAAVVRRSLSKLPQDRFADGAALAAALRDPATAVTQAGPAPEHDHTRVLPGVVPGVLPAEPTVVPGPVAGHLPDPPRVRRRNALWPVLAVLAVVAVAVIVFLLVVEGVGSDDPGDEPTRSPKQTGSSQPSSQPPSSEPTSEPPSSEPTSEPPSSEPTSEPPSSEPTSEPPSSEPTSASPTPTPTGSSAPATASAPATGTPASEPAASSTVSPSRSHSTQGEVDRR
jgi:eukaryotic-like serine/threonine-protein kinase